MGPFGESCDKKTEAEMGFVGGGAVMGGPMRPHLTNSRLNPKAQDQLLVWRVKRRKCSTSKTLTAWPKKNDKLCDGNVALV